MATGGVALSMSNSYTSVRAFFDNRQVLTDMVNITYDDYSVIELTKKSDASKIIVMLSNIKSIEDDGAGGSVVTLKSSAVSITATAAYASIKDFFTAHQVLVNMQWPPP